MKQYIRWDKEGKRIEVGDYVMLITTNRIVSAVVTKHCALSVKYHGDEWCAYGYKMVDHNEMVDGMIVMDEQSMFRMLDKRHANKLKEIRDSVLDGTFNQ